VRLLRGLIDATALGSGRGGDETMLHGIIRGLALAAGEGDRITVLCHRTTDVASQMPPPALELEEMPRRPGPLHFGLDLPRYLNRNRSRFDAVFTITHAPVLSPVPVAHMVQDLSYVHVPDSYPLHTRLRLRALIGLQIRSAGAVLTLSEFCRRDLISTYGLDPNHVQVVPCSVEAPPPLPAARREAALRWLAERAATGSFFLCLGNLHPRKNLVRTIRAFARSRRAVPALESHKLVVAGARWWGGGEEAEAANAAPGSVVFLGHVDDDVRQVLLESAVALLYLSLFEGFGLPPLEAMAASTPVLAAHAAAIPEVTGGAALLVDPRDEPSISDAITRIATEGPLRKDLVRRGRRRAAEYCPQHTGAAALRALSVAADRGMPARRVRAR
jgi:glycosyltransferase involved in cell wall biosynthesis